MELRWLKKSKYANPLSKCRDILRTYFFSLMVDVTKDGKFKYIKIYSVATRLSLLYFYVL